MKKGKALVRRIGMLTSGGDCQSLNATMRGVAKSLYKMFDDIEIVGFEDGYKGLMYADYRIMKQSDFSGILTRGGTILGTSRQPFKLMRTPDENGLDKVEAMKHTYYKLKLECLVILGRQRQPEDGKSAAGGRTQYRFSSEDHRQRSLGQRSYVWIP